MMQNYTVIQLNGKYRIYETQTEQYLQEFNDAKAARDCCRQMNNDTGWMGQTPAHIASLYTKNKEAA